MTSFTIEHTGSARHPRLVAPARLTPSDFDAIAVALGASPMRARKVAPVAARRVESEQVVLTHWKGEETHNTARPGDWIVTSLNRQFLPLRDGANQVNRYVLKPEKFAEIYERAAGENVEHGAHFRPTGVVDALPFPGGFDIEAPWGERQTGTAGYLMRSGTDVYFNEKVTFEETYEVIG